MSNNHTKEGILCPENIIVHALGGVKEKYNLLNSIDIMQRYYSAGFKMFEVDVWLTSDNVPVLEHRWSRREYVTRLGMQYFSADADAKEFIPSQELFLSMRQYGLFKTFSFKDFCLFMKENKDVFVMIDIAEKDYEATLEIYKLMVEIANYDSEIIDRWIAGAHSQEMINAIRSVYDFPWINMIFDIEKRRGEDVQTIGLFKEFCKKNNISSYSASYTNPELTKKTIKEFREIGLKSFVFTVEDKYKAEELLYNGIDYIGSDYLGEKIKDIENDVGDMVISEFEKENGNINVVFLPLPCGGKPLAKMGIVSDLLENGTINITKANETIWEMSVDGQLKYIETLLKPSKENIIFFYPRTSLTLFADSELLKRIRDIKGVASVVCALYDSVDEMANINKISGNVWCEKFLKYFDLVYSCSNYDVEKYSRYGIVFSDIKLNSGEENNNSYCYKVDKVLNKVINDYKEGTLKYISLLQKNLIGEKMKYKTVLFRPENLFFLKNSGTTYDFNVSDLIPTNFRVLTIIPRATGNNSLYYYFVDVNPVISKVTFQIRNISDKDIKATPSMVLLCEEQ